MIVVTGATGRTGRRVTEVLLTQGEKVRAVGRDARKLAPLVGLGAEPFVGTVENVSFLTAAFLARPQPIWFCPRTCHSRTCVPIKNGFPIATRLQSQTRMCDARLT